MNLWYHGVFLFAKHTTMYPTLLDLDTHETFTLPENESTVFNWTENNYSCDCNREIFVGKEAEQTAKLGLDDDTCIGSLRFVVVDVHGDLEGRGVDDVIQACNNSYPPAMQAQAQQWRVEQRIVSEKAALHETLNEGPPSSAAALPRPRL